MDIIQIETPPEGIPKRSVWNRCKIVGSEETVLVDNPTNNSFCPEVWPTLPALLNGAHRVV